MKRPSEIASDKIFQVIVTILFFGNKRIILMGLAVGCIAYKSFFLQNTDDGRNGIVGSESGSEATSETPKYQILLCLNALLLSCRRVQRMERVPRSNVHDAG